MPKGIRHGEERHVVHSLSLEKSLSKIHRLIRPISCIPRQLQDGSRGRSHGKACGFAWLPPARSLVSRFQIQRLFKSGEFKKKKKRRNFCKSRNFFLRLKRFYSEQTNAFETRRFDIFGFPLSFFKALTQDNDSKLQISSLVYSVVH